MKNPIRHRNVAEDEQKVIGEGTPDSHLLLWHLEEAL
jgi:hypothetical protein